MSMMTRARFRAAIVAIAPAVLLSALVYHLYIANITDKAAVTAALAFLAIRSYLRDAGEATSH